jgi:hypothetical protein
MTLPAICRLVHYVSYGSADGRYRSECRAAVVTETHLEGKDATAIGLAVLNPTGMFFDRNVRQSEGEHSGGTWHWPCITGEEIELPPAALLP